MTVTVNNLASKTLDGLARSSDMPVHSILRAFVVCLVAAAAFGDYYNYYEGTHDYGNGVNYDDSEEQLLSDVPVSWSILSKIFKHRY